jgi:hypothetical protein
VTFGLLQSGPATTTAFDAIQHLIDTRPLRQPAQLTSEVLLQRLSTQTQPAAGASARSRSPWVLYRGHRSGQFIAGRSDGVTIGLRLGPRVLLGDSRTGPKVRAQCLPEAARAAERLGGQLSRPSTVDISSKPRGSAKSRTSTIWPSRIRRTWMDIAVNDWLVVVMVALALISTTTTSRSWAW